MHGAGSTLRSVPLATHSSKSLSISGSGSGSYQQLSTDFDSDPDPDEGRLYGMVQGCGARGGMSGDTQLYRIDTGALTVLGDTGIERIMDFAFDTGGTMYATTANKLYAIKPDTGASTHISTITGVDSATQDPNTEIIGIMIDSCPVQSGGHGEANIAASAQPRYYRQAYAD